MRYTKSVEVMSDPIPVMASPRVMRNQEIKRGEIWQTVAEGDQHTVLVVSANRYNQDNSMINVVNLYPVEKIREDGHCVSIRQTGSMAWCRRTYYARKQDFAKKIGEATANELLMVELELLDTIGYSIGGSKLNLPERVEVPVEVIKEVPVEVIREVPAKTEHIAKAVGMLQLIAMMSKDQQISDAIRMVIGTMEGDAECT